MTSLQKINLGTAPTGQDGDTARAANVKMNSNVDVLSAQVALTSAPATITTASALTAATHLGKRVNIALTTAGTVQMPTAASCGADGIIHLRNTGTTVATLGVTTGSGDTVALSKLNPGESALMDTDGVHAWTVLSRGRTNSDNETVNGNCTVNGNETVGGTLSVAGSVTTGQLTANGNFTVNYPSNTVELATYSDTASELVVEAVKNGTPATKYTLHLAKYGGGVKIAGKTPWDNGNLVSPATTDTTQTISGAKTFSAASQFSGVATFTGTYGGTYTTSTINIQGGTSVVGIGFNANGIGGTLALAGASGFQFMDYQRSGFYPITCSTLTQASDVALKEDITTQGSVLDKLRGKRTVLYALKSDPSKTRHVGVIAQEWRTDFPELVTDVGVDIDEDGDFIAHQYDEDGDEIFGPNGKPESRKALGFNYSNASAVALQAAIELQGKLDAALERIAALEAKQP